MGGLIPTGRLARRNRRSLSPVAMFLAGAGTALLASYLDKRRRHIARDRLAATARDAGAEVDRKARYAAGVAKGAAHEATGPIRRADREYDDVTLARKVETELFRPADAPKDSVSVNVQDAIVELRGEVKRPQDIKALGDAAARIEGVRDVHNLLHTAGSPPKHSPPSEPDEVRARADKAKPPSRFRHNPGSTPPSDEPLVERAPAPDADSTR